MALTHRRLLSCFSVATALALLSACGGGGGGSGDNVAPNSAARAQGGYEGTLSGSTSSEFQLLLLEDGTYYAIFGTPNLGGVLEIEGFAQGSGTETSTTFVSSNGRDFGDDPPSSFNLDANYVADDSIDGRLTASGSEPVTFTGEPVSTVQYDYDVAALISDVVGTWDVLLGGTLESTLTILADGTYTGADVDGCNYSGTVAPRASGKNVFNVTYLEGPAPCVSPGLSVTGVAIVTEPTPDSRQLTVVGTNADRSEAFLAIGVPSNINF